MRTVQIRNAIELVIEEEIDNTSWECLCHYIITNGSNFGNTIVYQHYLESKQDDENFTPTEDEIDEMKYIWQEFRNYLRRN